MPTPDTLERFIARVEQGAHVEAILDFYTEGASMQENMGAPRVGREFLAAGERKVLAKTKAVHSQCVRPVFQQGDKVVIRWIFRFERLDGTVMQMEELAYQRWEGERIAEEQFFYDPAQMAAAPAPAQRTRAL
ncbi:nuclear transport factor 2 family protein [Roseateles toxinivorans]|uniref:SnoaL-like protein n=1 Tax=Roseateles toxinivorans TaxID=270368 RepID=A0A4R6QTS5_9BURK|nr:nuclear transport factor 2 family protein [Roseateles toxinivorans]TDP74279.1 SnoaL-like protein [Roseateles toxinivorans]